MSPLVFGRLLPVRCLLPGLILPFVAGWTQVRTGRAMLMGLVATLSALVGYFALTLSPLEGVPLDQFPAGLRALLFNGGWGCMGERHMGGWRPGNWAAVRVAGSAVACAAILAQRSCYRRAPAGAGGA